MTADNLQVSAIFLLLTCLHVVFSDCQHLKRCIILIRVLFYNEIVWFRFVHFMFILKVILTLLISVIFAFSVCSITALSWLDYPTALLSFYKPVMCIIT